MKNIIVLSSLLLLFLEGCGLYQKYERPQLDVDASLTRALEADTSLHVKPWKEIFTDSRLQALIEQALLKNTDLEVARLQVDESRAALLKARLAYLPSLTLNPQGTLSHYDGETKQTYNLGAAASWEVELFGRLTNTKREALAEVRAGEYYVQAVRTQLIATVAESYFTLLMLDEQIEIARATRTNWQETIATLEALAEAGRANEVSVHQARANLRALEANIKSLQQSVSTAENALSSLLKETSHPIERTTLASQHFDRRLLEGIPLEYLSQRPDVRRAEANLAAAFYATGVARSAFYPSLTLNGTLGWTNSGGGSIVNPGRWLSTAVAQLTQPLFNRGTNLANLEIAKARQAEMKLQFEQTLLDAAEEVNNALTAWQTARERIHLDQQQVDELTSAREKTQLLVDYTSSTYLEVLTVQQSLLSARLTRAQDEAAEIQAVVQLYHALGGGVE